MFIYEESKFIMETSHVILWFLIILMLFYLKTKSAIY